MKTLKDCKGTCDLKEYTVPAGTEVRFAGAGYVVESEEETARIVGSVYIARHYFLWLDKDAELK